MIQSECFFEKSANNKPIWNAWFYPTDEAVKKFLVFIHSRNPDIFCHLFIVAKTRNHAKLFGLGMYGDNTTLRDGDIAAIHLYARNATRYL